MSNIMHALIVDDESLAREDLIYVLNEFKKIKVVAEAATIESALLAINEHLPDLIFLDVKLHGETGFDLLNKLKTKPKIIFVTAYDEYAIRAFEVNAQDYLLKPVTKERLQQTLDNISEYDNKINQEFKKLEYSDRIFLMIDNKYTFLKIDTIIAIKAADDYTEILIADQKTGLVHKTMQEWETRLPVTHFARIHRSTIININYIDKIDKWFNNSFKVFLKNVDTPFVISRRYAMKIKEIYN